MAFDLGFFGDLFGGGTPSTPRFFQDDPLAEQYRSVLGERLRPVTEQPDYFRAVQGLRDALDLQARTARQRLGDAAVTGGFADSGALIEGSLDIERASQGAFSSGLANILDALEARRTAGVLPFLSALSQEALGGAQLELQGRGQDLQFFSSLAQSFAPLASGGGLPFP